MTRNNLRAHLAWLLERPDPLDHLVIPEAPLETQVTATPTALAADGTRLSPDRPLTTTNIFVQPAVAHTSDDALPNDTMAILQLTSPPPRNRRYGLLGADSSSVDVPGTPAHRTPIKRDLYKPETQTPKPRLKKRSVTSITTPPTSNSSSRKAKAKPQQIYDSGLKPEVIESIDLTAELPKDSDGHLSSPGSASTFGEPRRLWREDFASRPEPRTNSYGKKRKSSDYEADLHQSKKLSSPASQSHSLKIGTVGRESTKDLKPTHNRATQRVINDSEDDGIYLDLMEDDIIYPELPLKKEGPPATRTSKPTVVSRQTPEVRVRRSISPPLFRPTSQMQRDKSDIPQGSTPDTMLTKKEQNPLILRYLRTSPASLNPLLNSLNHERTTKAKHAVDLLVGDYDNTELMREVKTLASKINALTELQRIHAEFCAAEANVSALKADLIRCVEMGGESPDISQVLKARQESQKLQQTELKVLELLKVSGIFNGKESAADSSVSPPPDQKSKAGNDDSFSRQVNQTTATPQPVSVHGLDGDNTPISPTLPITRPFESRGSSGAKREGSSRPSVPVPRWSQERPPNITNPNPVWSCNDSEEFDDAEEFIDILDDERSFSKRPEPPYSRNMGPSLVLETAPVAYDSEPDDCATRNPVIDEFEDLFEYTIPEDAPPPPPPPPPLLFAPPPLSGHSQLSSREVFRETSGNSSKPTSTQPGHQKDGGMMSSIVGHPWSKDVKSAMREVFHLRGFRPNQLESINSTLSGRDTFVLMPTGGGKSLCYQLPSIIKTGKTKGVTIVISPLLSLMQDQVAHLQKLSVKAFLINGDVSKEERASIMSNLRSLRADTFINLLYITPEMLAKSGAMESALLQLHSNHKLARIVIDEAHCVSQWGHDFRPDYTALGRIREKYSGVPVMALTATATPNVQVDVIHNLRMKGCDIFTQSFNRPNLTYEVRRKGRAQDALKDIAELITTEYPGKCGIIYCLSRKSCEKVAMQLSTTFNVKAMHYHAGLPAKERFRVQRDWQAGKYTVIVATIAFGMGIDKPNVRFVIHLSIPQSLEGYYQETGRAGRDGKRSECYLYFSYGDKSSITYMIDKNKETTQEQKSRQRLMLRHVTQFCENDTDCRRAQILAYFDEKFKREDCNRTCDNCKSDFTFERRDFTEHAAAAIKLVEKLAPAKVTALFCVDAFRGYPRQSDYSHLPEYGHGTKLERGDVERLFRYLLYEDALEEDNVPNRRGFIIQYVKPGANAQRFKSGRQKTVLPIRISPEITRPAAKRSERSYTGVRATREENPESTNVSSPIQREYRRRARIPEELAEEDDDSDGFAPIRERGKPLPSRHPQLGHRITEDGSCSGLNELHKVVLDEFFSYAKAECEKIKMDKHLREQPFSDSILLEMGIRFPSTLDELSQIHNIDRDKVRRYGPKFLSLIARSKKRYDEMAGCAPDHGDETVHDPNHENVVTISSDDEMYGDWSENEFDYVENVQQESPYFPPEDNPPPSFKKKGSLSNSLNFESGSLTRGEVSQYQFSESTEQPLQQPSHSRQNSRSQQANSKRPRVPKSARGKRPQSRPSKRSQESRPTKKRSSSSASGPRNNSKGPPPRTPSIGIMPT